MRKLRTLSFSTKFNNARITYQLPGIYLSPTSGADA